MIVIEDSNNLRVKNVPSQYSAAIKKKLSIADPTYYKLKRMGTPVWGRASHFTYYQVGGDDLILPKGFLQALQGFLDRSGMEYQLYTKKVTERRTEPLISKITLRNYQVPLVTAMGQHDRGIIHLSTGGGKTICALEHIARTNLKTTIIVKDKTLLHQFATDCKTFLNYEAGQVGDNKKEVKDITIATVQTLQSDPDLLEQLSRQTGLLIVDEIQEFVTEKRIQVLDVFAPTQFFGLTATPYRSVDDGRTDAIGFIFGPIIGQHTIQQMKPRVRVYCTNAKIQIYPKYSEIIDEQIQHHARNTLIAGIAAGEAYSGNKVLILTKRIEHAAILFSALQAVGGTYHIESGMKEKADLLREFREYKLDFSILIGTTSLLGTGFDIPKLNRLLLAGDMKSNVLTEQSVGRILRLLQGKDPVVYDFVDDKNAILRSQFTHRRKIYKQREWEIEYHPEYMNKWL